MFERKNISLILILLFISIGIGCVQYVESPNQGNQQPTSQIYQTSTPYYPPTYQQPTTQQSWGCAPSLSNCQITRGAADQIIIQCPNGRQYTRGSAGQIIIQYPGKQITVGSAGQEIIQGFNYQEARCLIDWLRNF